MLIVFGPPGLADSLTVFIDSSLKNISLALIFDQVISINKNYLDYATLSKSSVMFFLLVQFFQDH